MPEEPLPWDQIESDPEFQAIPLPEKEKVFQGWNQEVTGYLKGQGAPEPEVADFQKAATERFRTKFVAPVVAQDSATLFNLARDPLDTQTLGAIRQQERAQPLVQKESEYAKLDLELQQEGVKPFVEGSQVKAGGVTELKPEQLQKLQRMQELRDSFTPTIAGQEFPSEGPTMGNLFGATVAAQLDKELFQGFKDSSGAVAGGALGAKMLSGLRAGPVGALLPIAGAVGGSLVGGAVQEKGTQLFENNPEVTAARQQRQAQMAEGQDYKLGGLLAMGSLFRPSLSVMKAAAKGNEQAIQQIGIGGGLGAGMTAIDPAMRGELPTPGQVLEGGALGLAFHQPTQIASKMFGFRPLVLEPNPATQTVRTPIGTVDPVGRIVEPGTPEGTALRAVAGLDATKPTEVPAPSQDAQNLLDIIAARHTSEQGVTDWPAVREVLQKMQPSQSTNPEFLGVMDEALKMAEAQAPRTIEQEVAPDLAPERVVEPPKPPAPEVAPAPESVLPPDYQRAVDLPPAKAARELNLPVEEVQRRAAVAKEVLSDKYGEDPLASPEVRKFKSLERPEGGALGGAGGARPKPKPIGLPPSGSTEWLKIKPFYARGGISALREGAEPVLVGRQKNPIGKQLGRASRRQADVEEELAGRMYKDLSRGVRGLSKARQEAAFNELEAFQREKENGRPTPPLSADAQRVLSGWQDVAEFTGLLAQAKNVKVADAGGYRPMRLIGRDYTPRMVKPEVMRTLRDPEANPAEFNRLAGELAAQRSITPEEAAAFLNGMAGGKGRSSSNDFMGNIEVGRQERLPESFYEYDLRKIIPHYVDRYAKRMAQIVAYGQRLGPDNNPIQKNLWDYARAEVRGGDKTTMNWLNEAEAQSRNERELRGLGRLGARIQTAATGLLLGNPTTTVARNLLSGLETQLEMFGTRRTLGAFKDVFNASERAGAKEMGIVRDDIASMLHAEQLPADSMVDRGIRATTDAFLKYSGYNASEVGVRTINSLTAQSYARDAAKAINANPTSKLAKEAQAMFKRLNVDPTKIAAENGEWRTGAETQKFIRAAVAQTQGSYKFSQVPLWAGTPGGRFFYQFGRWGTQRFQNLWENVFKPAFIGTDIMVGGVPMTVRDMKPLARMAVGTVALGEAFGALGQIFKGQDRKDASFTEIGAAMNEDQKKAMAMIGGRILNDVIMSGSMGILGQPIDLLKAAKDGSRAKNPAEPPAMNMARSVVEFGRDVWDQGEVTGDDVKHLALSTVPGPTAVVDSLRNYASALPEDAQVVKEFFQAQKYEAENDVRTLRNAGMRFAESTGMDIEEKGKSDFRKNPRSPVYASIRDALLIGDASKAKLAVDNYLKSLPAKDRAEARQNIKSSVRARQPFRIGPYNDDATNKKFMKWAEKNLPKEDLDQITRVQARYKNAAKAVGLD